MRREYLLVAAASAVALCMIISGAEAVPTKQAGSFVASGMISGGKTEDDGSSWIRLWSEDSRYVVGSSDKGRRDELWRLLHAAHGSNHAISVRYDAGAGRINSTAKTLDYPVCTITFGDIQFASSRACDTKSLSTSPETALALGFAHAQDGGAKTARELLDEALAKGPRDIIFRAIALRARADALSMIAFGKSPGSVPADKARIAALEDYRAIAKIAPTDREVLFAIGTALEDLGDYAAATKEFSAILERYPDEDFRVTVRLSAIARHQGDSAKSLTLLNGLVERAGRQLGMKFYYHRGWTLSNLGRFDEAIKDLGEGLKAQPDYAWAYARRGCAHASVGQLPEALADMDMALQKYTAFVAINDPGVRHDKAQFGANSQRLKASIARGERGAMPGMCGQFWGDDDKPRARSALLRKS